MFLPSQAIIRYNYIKHRILVYSVNGQFEISIFTIVLIEVLIKYDKFEFTNGPWWWCELKFNILYQYVY